jgi:hypothetical protein
MNPGNRPKNVDAFIKTHVPYFMLPFGITDVTLRLR